MLTDTEERVVELKIDGMIVMIDLLLRELEEATGKDKRTSKVSFLPLGSGGCDMPGCPVCPSGGGMGLSRM